MPTTSGVVDSTSTPRGITSDSFNCPSILPNEADLVKLKRDNYVKYSAVPVIRKTFEKPANFDKLNPYQKMNETVKKTEAPSMSKKLADSIEQIKDF